MKITSTFCFYVNCSKDKIPRVRCNFLINAEMILSCVRRECTNMVKKKSPVTSVFSSGNQATFVASGGWLHWCIFGGNRSYLLQKQLDR